MLEGKGLDERTSLLKALREKEQELVTALGGDPSPQEQAIIGDSVKNMLYIASLDNYLMSLKELGPQRPSSSGACDPDSAIPPIYVRT